MTELEKMIGRSFSDPALLTEALTHSSFANEHRCDSYERLEFVGDAVLGLVTARYLYTSFPGLNEGEMTRKRAEIVCEKNLYKCACALSLGEYARLSRGELNTGGRNRVSILADMVESIIAAIYLDAGFEAAERFIYDRILLVYSAEDGADTYDYKSRFQELVQRNGAVEIAYTEIGETGPDHDKVFEFSVSLDGVMMGTGKGRTKKDAEQQAAKNALEIID